MRLKPRTIRPRFTAGPGRETDDGPGRVSDFAAKVSRGAQLRAQCRIVRLPPLPTALRRRTLVLRRELREAAKLVNPGRLG